MAVEMCAFKLNQNATKAELDAYAKRRGFYNIGAMASFAFYSYLEKAHYPFREGIQVQKTPHPPTDVGI